LSISVAVLYLGHFRDCPDNCVNITSDQLIEYTSHRSMGNNLRPVRRVGYRDGETGKHYVFIINHLDWSAKTVAEIYRQRWQVELFFKWIKQNLKINAFIGNSGNAVMTLLFTALCIYLLLAYIKFSNGFSQSLQQISRLLPVNLFAKRTLSQLFRPPPERRESIPQLRLAL